MFGGFFLFPFFSGGEFSADNEKISHMINLAGENGIWKYCFSLLISPWSNFITEHSRTPRELKCVTQMWDVVVSRNQHNWDEWERKRSVTWWTRDLRGDYICLLPIPWLFTVIVIFLEHLVYEDDRLRARLALSRERMKYKSIQMW